MARHLDFQTLVSVSLSCRFWLTACEREISKRHDCNWDHEEIMPLWSTKIEQAYQIIKCPQFANEYGSIKTGRWASDLCGFKFGPRPSEFEEFSEEKQYDGNDDGKIALSRTIIASRCAE